MSYGPIEGVDYLVDYYALIGADPSADPSELHHLLNEQTGQYHPDRLHGMAPDLLARGEHMTSLLNRARGILLDEANRAEYDDICAAWEGPLSTDGTAIVSERVLLRANLASLGADELEAQFAGQQVQIEATLGYTPNRLSLLERLLEQTGDEVPADLRAEYEAALLQRDHVLAAAQAERAAVLGISFGDEHYEVGIGYIKFITGEIAAARTAQTEELKQRALGGVGVRLALMAGDTQAIEDTPAQLPATLASVELPVYFEPQAERVTEIARERAGILKKRLANFRPDYPLAELQTQAHDTLIVGIHEGDESYWFALQYDPQTDHAELVELPRRISRRLERQDFRGVIEQGYSLLTYRQMDQVDFNTQANEAVIKHLAKYGIQPIQED